MTMVERIAAAIAVSRTGSSASWRDYRAEAQWMIDACAPLLEPRPARPWTSIGVSSAIAPLPRG